MPGDRERLSFDPDQNYRSVVMQQGRVTVPADFNEAQEILREELIEETKEIVGPVGTPDDGYKLGFPGGLAPFDFTVGKGTMYVGGVRVEWPQTIPYSKQPDWLDVPPPDGGRNYVYLRLEEREISAVEDSALREVALGGPDTTQRTRLLQRVISVNTDGTDCPSAFAGQLAQWAGQGWDFDPTTVRPRSRAALQVGFDNAGGVPGPCEPAASGAYLGAENQLIRVRLSAKDKFVWGFDNASFLYRVSVIDTHTIKLDTPPPDTFHFPRAGQVIELLRAEAKLANGEFVAYGEGLTVKLAEAYNPDSQTIKLPDPLPAEYQPKGTPRLFLRVWEDELSFTAGTAVKLGTTGVTVTLSGSPGLHTGDFWSFAVRPNTPALVYPERYLDGPQPPDGPRFWVCPLGVVQWTVVTGNNAGGANLLADCREGFDNLVTLTKRRGQGCCTVMVGPADLANTTLTAIIQGIKTDLPIRICLAPGVYDIRSPIMIRRNDVTIEACPGGATLRAVRTSSLRIGMIVVQNADRVKLSGLELIGIDAPVKSLMRIDAGQLAGPIGGPNLDRFSAAIGVRVLDANEFRMENCRVELPSELSTPSMFAVGVYLSGSTRRTSICRCQFERVRVRRPVDFDGNDVTLAFGIAQANHFIGSMVQSPTGANVINGQAFASVVRDAVFADNTFRNLSAALFVQGDMESVRVERNRALACHSGYWLMTQHTLGFAQRIFDVDHKEVGGQLKWQFTIADPVMLIGSVLVRTLESPDMPGPPRPFNNVPIAQTQPFPPIQPVDINVRFFRLWSILNAAEQQAFAERADLVPSIYVVGNEADLVRSQLGDGRVFSSHALMVWAEDYAKDTPVIVPSTTVVSDNRLRADVPTFCACVLFVHAVTITGNIFQNNINDNFRSLIVGPTISPPGANTPNAIAITGNVCRGIMSVPPRPLAAPLNDWSVLNTIYF